MFQPLDGPFAYTAITVTTTPVELKVGATVLPERKTIAIQPLTGDIFYGFDNLVSATTGLKAFQNIYIERPATDSVSIYLVTAAGSVDVRIAEFS